MKVSIITACYNSAKTLPAALQSVAEQGYNDLEHIIVDGKSNDDTAVLVKQFEHITEFISEPDDGVYDALNKGIKRCTGDIIAILHADDQFKDSTVVSDMVDALVEKKAKGVYGDIEFINADGKRIRYYSSKYFKKSQFRKAMMPAHPSCFFRKEIYEAIPFNLNYKIASDFDQVLRTFLHFEKDLYYVPRLTTRMLPGGLSTASWRSNLQLNREAMESCRANGIQTNLLLVYSKYLTKIFSFFKRG